MSYCQKQGPGGKDTVIFATKEDHSVPSTVDLPVPEPQAGLLLPNGDINWNCPCLGGMATGPCGVPFRNAFSCFHYSTADPKGSDCYEKFRDMQECMTKYPSLYNKHTMEDDDDSMGIQDALNQSEQSTSANTNAEKQSALQDRDKTKSEKST